MIWRIQLQPFMAVFMLAVLCAALNSAKAGDLGAVDLSSLYVEVSEKDSNFTVVDARVDETATAAVLFGVIGAGLNSAANASEDDKKAETLRDAASKVELKKLLFDSIVQTITTRDSIPVSVDQSGASHTLQIEIRNWGLIRKNRETQEMRVFLNLTLKLLDERKKIVWEKKRENNVGQKADVFEAFTQERFQEEMEELAKKSGQYVAYQIIYR